MIEIFKDIPGYEGLYQVSNMGRIKSLNVFHYNDDKEKILILKIKKDKYFEIKIKGKYYLIHRLVMLTFIGECPKDKQVNHIDGNKQNNRLENLEYITSKENTQHAWKNGLCKGNGLKKKVNQYDKNNNLIKQFESVGQAERETKILHSNIFSCCYNRLKTSGGYIWKFA
jgi:hypothetical protein